MNSYNLSRKWFDFCFDNPEKIKPRHTALYFFAIEHCNRLGWKEKFGFPTTMAKEAIGIGSYNTFKKTLDDLVEWGFLKLIQKSQNQYSSNIIALSNFDKPSDKSLDKALINHNKKQVESTLSINKQTNKGTSNNKPYSEDFEEFWELYDVKKGKKKAWMEWKNLSIEAKEEIMGNVPIFLTHFSNKQYTPRPRKYLHNRYWEDEGYQNPLKPHTNGQEKQVDKARRHLEQTKRIFND